MKLVICGLELFCHLDLKASSFLDTTMHNLVDGHDILFILGGIGFVLLCTLLLLHGFLYSCLGL